MNVINYLQNKYEKREAKYIKKAKYIIARSFGRINLYFYFYCIQNLIEGCKISTEIRPIPVFVMLHQILCLFYRVFAVDK